MITWENFSNFIQQLPPGEDKIFVEESVDHKLPNTWEYLGTLFDSRINPGVVPEIEKSWQLQKIVYFKKLHKPGAIHILHL